MTGRPLAYLVGGVVLGALCAAVVYALAVRPDGPSGSASSELERLSAQIANLETEIRALGEWKLEVLRGALPKAEASPTPPAESLSPAADEKLEAVLASLQRISERVDALAAEAPSRQSPPELPDLQTYASLDPGRFEALRDRADATEEHLSWSYEKVLETYGRPTGTRTRDDGEVRFIYDLPEGKTFVFSFVNGKVIRALWA